jgi:hypothetical protein
MARTILRTLLLVALLFLGGCYQYTTVPLDSLAPPQEVRVRVTGEQADRLEEATAGQVSRLVEGRVAQLLEETLLLDVNLSLPQAGTRSMDLAQRVDLPFSGILEVEEKTFSRNRTALVVGGGVALVGVALATWVIRSGGETGGDLPPSDEMWLPLPRMP